MEEKAMTIPDLIQHTLGVIQARFYQHQVREFYRDRVALVRAISRWGVECCQRGWHFDADFIAAEILAVLGKIKRQDFDYLPAYLHEAISRSVGQRAEELSAAAKKRRTVAPLVNKVLAGTQVVQAVIQQSDTEALAQVYSLFSRGREKKQAKQIALKL